FDEQAVREFAPGLEEVLVIEDKGPFLERHVRDALYGGPHQPVVSGTRDARGATLVPAAGAFDADAIARLVGARLLAREEHAGARARLEQLGAADARRSPELGPARTPFFCSGCPHNTSTAAPDDTLVGAGIGCHTMVLLAGPGHGNVSGLTQMGGEGAQWIGMEPFLTPQHYVQNIGDGTFHHSGSLAVRAAVAAGLDVTYKLLYNDAVAMTGGQQVGERPEGHSVTQIMNSPISEGVTVHHRDELDRIQREFREIAGTSVIIYDQTCATEKRRRRKRGKLVDPAKRVVINELVCEGCGDCSIQSNCLSVEPLETDFGRKRQINQNTCNKDYSCVKGFCPSFVTVEGGELKKPKKEGRKSPFDAALGMLPMPVVPNAEQAWGIVVAGVGGTGVITIGQLLGMAAHLEGKGVITQDAAGLAQKGGATWSHIQIANQPEAIYCTKVGTAEADLVIACDAIVAANKATLAVMREGRTFVALNTHGSPTATLVNDPDWSFPGTACEQALGKAVGEGHLGAFDAEDVAVKLLGDSLYTNPLMLGYAWQQGRIPLSYDALMRAIELNGVQVDNNKAAFEWGRRCAHDLKSVQSLYAAQAVIQLVKRQSLDEIVAKRVEFLTGYQNAAYAAEYQAFVDKVRAAEAKLGSKTTLTEAVARYLFKLMAYKDEYEVARLHTDVAFTNKIAGMFEGDYKLVHHLAPPLFAKKNDKGELVKRPFGGWIRPAFGLLARMKGLRGTAFDIFGHTEERRMERRWIADYRAGVDKALAGLSAESLPTAVELARVPEDIRGYGHVKARHEKAAKAKWDALLAKV
ncbi:indolepyruvate ferredoxin oxidoreductase family protein, partial [Roseateles sp.]|uniref:indolepyruvate ferredoxin oxidoreductase family protein n=1 Tax=Roseateles sp. TaxID=1971397 RepID=UPI0025EAAC44